MNDYVVEIDYTNHRGERRKRKIMPVGQLFFSSNQWHPEEQWLFNAVDMDEPSQQVKTFALAGLCHTDVGDEVSIKELEEKHDARVSDLLKANNEYLERARASEAREKDLLTQIDELKGKLTKEEAEVDESIGRIKELEEKLAAAQAPAAVPEPVTQTEPAPTPSTEAEPAKELAPAND